MKLDIEKYEKAGRKRRYKMINWGVLVQKLESRFQAVIEQAKKESFFENLYISRNDDQKQIQLFSGRHPIGINGTAQSSTGTKTKHKIVSEGGATLVFSQSALGYVAIILYPFSSESLNQSQSHIVIEVLTGPSDVTNTKIDHAIKYFFCYMRVSSSLFSESRLDRLRIRYLEFKSRRYQSNYSIGKFIFSHWSVLLLGAIGSVASIYSLWK